MVGCVCLLFIVLECFIVLEFVESYLCGGLLCPVFAVSVGLCDILSVDEYLVSEAVPVFLRQIVFSDEQELYFFMLCLSVSEECGLEVSLFLCECEQPGVIFSCDVTYDEVSGFLESRIEV